MSGQQNTVLYIEDNAANRQLIEMILARRPGITLLLAETGGGGLAVASERLPGLILLDLSLPDMDGIDVLTRLKEESRTATIPVYALSGDPHLQYREGAPLFDGFLAKPIDIQKLFSVVDQHLGS
jgi:CheY-like chemotaxis protein